MVYLKLLLSNFSWLEFTPGFRQPTTLLAVGLAMRLCSTRPAEPLLDAITAVNMDAVS